MTTDNNLLNLMTWLSPSFPVGGYAYSHGIEYAVEDGRVKDEHDLTAWIKAALSQGTGRIDGALFCAVWQAVTDNDMDRLRWAIERADLMRGTSEMVLESSAQGQAFIDTILQTWESPRLKELADVIRGMDRQITYAVAVSVVSSAAEIPLREALLAYYHAFAANLVSAGVRLVPLGQIAGQRCLQTLKPVITEITEAAITGKYDDLGTAAPLIDWASMKHETQYTRLFRS
ncbi:MAG: urease accessory protein UreF [Rhodospirillales bacterium]|jgi:urease accessory protein